MSESTIVQEVNMARQDANLMLPKRDFTGPGPRPMSLDDAANKIAVEYSEALELLGRI